MSSSCVRPELYFLIVEILIKLELLLFQKMIFLFVSLFVNVVRETSLHPLLLLTVCFNSSVLLVEIKNFLSDVRSIGTTYPGGVPKYIDTASKLIDASTKNINPFDGFKAEVGC